MSYYPCVEVLSENDSIIGSLQDLLSVCLRDYIAVTSQLTQVTHRITFGRRSPSSCVFVLGLYLTIGGFKDLLVLHREGVWLISIFLNYVILRIHFCEGIAC